MFNMFFFSPGHISAALVLGGVDCTGPHLYTVFPHGSTDKVITIHNRNGFDAMS